MDDEALEKTALEYDGKLKSNRDAEEKKRIEQRETELLRSGLSSGMARHAATLKIPK